MVKVKQLEAFTESFSSLLLEGVGVVEWCNADLTVNMENKRFSFFHNK